MDITGASFVRVELPANENLSLAEVQVFGGNLNKMTVEVRGTSRLATFDGSYGSDPEYGSFNQDFVGGGGIVGGPEKDKVRMFGNAWKVYKLGSPVTVMQNTVLEFNFEMTEESEGNALCLDEDKNDDTYSGLQIRCISMLADDGTNQVNKWENVHKLPMKNYSSTYRVNIGKDLFKSQSTIIKYIAFIQDNDKSPRKGKSSFSAINIFDDNESNQSKSLSWKFDREIKITMGNMRNIALSGTATQSSEINGGKASRAIDGNTSGDSKKGSVTFTKSGQNNWWMVQLNGIFYIKKVIIWNRTDCCRNRISNAIVRILGYDGVTTLKTFRVKGHVTNEVKFEFDMDITGASFVRVQLPTNTFLSLAEVQVFGFTIKLPKSLSWLSSVSVSGHLNNALYESGGRVYLLKKSSTGTTCSDTSFPACLKITYDTLQRNGWKTAYTTPFSEERGGLSTSLLFGFFGIRCTGSRCDKKELKYVYNRDTILDEADTYTIDKFGSKTHEKTAEQGRELCKHGYFVRRIKCDGSHCNRISLACSKLKSNYRASDETFGQPEWISKEDPNTSECPNGYYVYGLGCRGDDCREIKLYCRKIEKVNYPSLVHNVWKTYYALPDNKELSDTDKNPTKCPTGTEVPEDECLIAGITSAYQWGKVGVKWLLETDDKTGFPCGCYIYNEEYIHYNRGTRCQFKQLTRLVCRPKKINPELSKVIVIRQPSNIGSDNRFGLGAKALSNDGSVIAIAIPGATKVAIYTINGSSARLRRVIDGDRVDLSNDGSMAGVVKASSSGCNVMIYGRYSKDDTFVKANGEISNEFSCSTQFLGEGFEITHQNNIIKLYTKNVSYKLTCVDKNSILKIGDSEKPVACMCNDGYVSTAPTGGKILTDGYSCISSLHSTNVEVTSDQIKFQILKSTANDYNETSLMKHATSNDIQIILTSNKFSKSDNGDKKVYQFSRLEPGSRYNVSLINPHGNILSFPAVTTCSCDQEDSDRTGRPKSVTVVQRNGHVMFQFTDNSKCEEAFSFTRSDYAEEFLADVSLYGVAFTRDYFFIGGKDCGSMITTGTGASDNLSYSKLPVGKTFVYCVRGVHSSHYMDHPFDDSEDEIRKMTSSDDSCAPHKIRWEASIHIMISTEPNAGSLPIKDVEVSWELLDMDSKTPIDCTGCLGNGTTTGGGTFDIIFNVDDPFFYQKNYVDIPVKIKFAKKSGNITHSFLCNEGEADCSEDIGTTVYLRHLDFKQKIRVYDDTSVPFSGKATIADTTYAGSSGCLLPNVEVCLIQERSIGATKQNETLVCGKTGPDGTYSLPAIIGSTIHYVNMNYHDHKFRPSSNSKYEKGMTIEEGGYYGDNDFEDVEKSELIVEVAGGLCNKPLGKSTVNLKIVGCEWEGENQAQLGTISLFQSAPAHILEIQVTEINDKDGERLQNVWAYFQGEQPQTRRIDLTNITVETQTIKEKENQKSTNSYNGTTGKDDLNVADQDAKRSNSVWKDIENDLNHVRFQFDGELEIFVNFDKDNLECQGDPRGRDSLHVLSYMTSFGVSVELKYKLLEDVYCDIVDEDIKIAIDNQVGFDQNQGFEEFEKSITDPKTKHLLEHCSHTNGGCLYSINHETDDEGKKIGRAGIYLQFATGRPNVSPPHIKDIIFSVQGGVTDVSHTAGVFVEGLYSKGPGRSFALPTHEPIMILRDPPGGLSYATYENVLTKIKVDMKSDSASVSTKIGGGFRMVIDVGPDLCSGGGLGVIVLNCLKPVESNIKTNVLQHDTMFGNVVKSEEETLSNEFSTTWNYETSQDPWLAGAMSDVFVVPNLNVMYKNVDQISWDNTTCNAAPVLSKVVFDLNDPSTKNAMSFYSRYHVETVKLPELRASKNKYGCCDDNVTNGTCIIDENDGIVSTSNCTNELKQKYKVLKVGIKGWEKALEVEKHEKATKLPITEWFESDAGEEEISSGLVPPAWTKNGMVVLKGTNALKPENKNQVEWEEQLKNVGSATRLQFSGGSGLISMTMKKDKISEHLKGSCWGGCSRSIESDTELPGLAESDIKIVGAGLDFRVTMSLHTMWSHDSNIATSNKEETSIGFVLGDGDPGDEFVVDFFVDQRFGTIVFNTVSGQSKCPHEIGTSAMEDPKMEIRHKPSEVVFPNDPMIFEVTISNVGVGDESLFVLSNSKEKANADGLTIIVDGSTLVGSREFSNMERNKEYKKTVIVKRGPTLFKYAGGIELSFGSSCDDNDSMSVTRTLFNYQDTDAQKFIKFIEPCPKVEWAGELQRDHGFLVNTDSSSQKDLLITISNPLYQTKYYNMTSDRLKHVKILYRKLGDVLWNTALTEQNGEKVDLDFAALYQYEKEDSYGYSSLKWSLSPTVKEGAYEIKVGTRCIETGGPTDIDMFDAPILTGVIDLTRPRQYGKELPLRETVMIGEEISIIFTEPLQCEKPFTFDLKVIIEGTDYKFDREELQVVCEGRKIGFQIDLSLISIGVNELLGKVFSVELGKIGIGSKSNVFDVNGNGLDPLIGNIKFEKKFGELNLKEASSRFLLTLNGNPCVDNTEYDINSKVASILGLDSTKRITSNALTCHGTDKTTAEVTILPPLSGGRMLKRKLGNEEEEDHSVALFYKIRDSAIEVGSGKRKLLFKGKGMDDFALSFAVSQMKILPCDSDMHMFQTDPDLVEEEEELLHLASFGNTPGDKQSDVILQELRLGLKHGYDRMEEMKKHEDEKMEEMKKHEDEKMEEMKKHEDEKMEKMKKHEDEKMEVMKKHEDEKMEVMKKYEDEKMEVMQRNLVEVIKKHEDEKRDAMEKHEAIMLNEIHSLQTELVVVTILCVIVSVAAFLKLKN